MNQTIDSILVAALKEDMPAGDVTTDALCDESHCVALAIAKDAGTISGLDVFARVFWHVDPDVNVTLQVTNGTRVHKGMVLARVEGRSAAVLKAERTALNIVQRMSGIATLTRAFVDAVEATACRILDTRKTAPLIRILDKQAVRDGGGENHRFSLSDRVLIKDNHIVAAGGIERAVAKARAAVGKKMLVEVEVETLEQFKVALQTDTDWIMLDNMTPELMRECVTLNAGRKVLEASGNMSLERVEAVAQSGVDCISVGALTHSVQAFDISLRFQPK